MNNERDPLDHFLDVLRLNAPARSRKKINQILPAHRRANEKFSELAREFSLMMFDQIATNHAARHGKQKSIGDSRVIQLWLGIEIEHAPAIEQLHLKQALNCSYLLVAKSPASDYDVSGWAAVMFSLLADSVCLDYQRWLANRSFLARKFSQWRNDEFNFGWEHDVIGRLGAVLPALSTNARRSFMS